MTKSVAEKLNRDFDHAVEEVVHDLRHARQRVRAGAEDTVGAITELAAEARDRTQAAAQIAVRTVRDRPVAAIAIAAGLASVVGFLVGRIISRRS